MSGSNIEIIERKVKVKLYFEKHTLNVPADESILQAAMGESLDPPFSCQIGACAACRAKLISGDVYMDSTEALTEDEIKEGWILTCQAHPITDDVLVDYDN